MSAEGAGAVPTAETRKGGSVQVAGPGHGRLLKPAEVADWLGVPVKTVLYWGSTGRLARVKLGRNVRFSQGAVEALIAAGTEVALDARERI